MPLRRIREELDLLNAETARSEPNLEFILIHSRALHDHALDAAECVIYSDTSEADRTLIERFAATTGRTVQYRNL